MYLHAMATMQCYYLIFSLLCIIFSFLLSSIFKKLKTSSNSRLRLPPSPPALPLIGHLHLLSLTVHKSLAEISSKYGPLLYLRIGTMPCIHVSSASIATEIFKTLDSNFSFRPESAFRDSILFGDSGFIAAPYGGYWRFMKKICVTELLGMRHIERSRSVRREEIMQLVRKVLRKASDNEVVDVGSELGKLACTVLYRMVTGAGFSEEINDRAEMMKKMVEESLVLTAKLIFADALGPCRILASWLFEKKAKDLIKKYDEILERLLQEHEERAKREGERSENKDLMDILLEVYHDDKVDFKITKHNIKAFLLDLLVAGISGADEAVKWAIAELINHPDVFSKVREEIESVVGRSRLVEESDIPNLPFLQAVVKESLRMHLPIPVIVRECYENCNIKGFDIPEKTTTAINVYAIMRDPDLWEKPNEFQPERFLVCPKEQDNNQDGETEKQLLNFLPFGGGRRSCPGSLLSLALMNTAIAAMVQCFDFEVDAKLKLEAGSGMSLSLPQQLLCRPVVHFNPFA